MSGTAILSSWKETSVRELVEKNILFPPMDGNHGEIHPKGNDFTSSGIPFIMASDISNSQILFNSCKRISAAQAESLRKGFAITEDVLLTHKATLGRTAIVGNLSTPYIILTPQVTYYRIKDCVHLSNKYLKYYFDSPFFQGQLVNHGDSGSTRSYIGITAQLDLPVILPPLQEQKAIAAVLSSLDDKIDLLHRQNATLEAMAEALFKQWFVVGAKEEGERTSLRNCLQLITRGVTPRYADSGIPVLNQKCIRAKEINSSFARWHDISKPVTENKYLCIGDILINSTGVGTLGRVAQVLHLDAETLVDSHITIVRAKEGISWNYLGFNLLSRQEEIEYLGEGSTGQTELARERLGELEVTVPPMKLIHDFDLFTIPMRQKSVANQRQIRTLEKLRDLLLPKLMNGEIRVAY